MGAGASIPDKLDLEKTKELAGERFDDGQFETMAGPDGCITREQLLEAGNLVDFDASKLTEEVARNGMFFSFNEFDEDDSGGLSYEEFAQAAEQLGFAIEPEKLSEVCLEIDVDKSGIIDQAEFVAFIMKRQAPVEVDLEGVDCSSVFEHIRPSQAQYGCERGPANGARSSPALASACEARPSTGHARW